MRYYAVLLITLLLFSVKLQAQIEKQDLRCALFNAYVDDNMPEWRKIITEMEALEDSSQHWQQEILLAYYGLTGYFIGNKREKDARLELNRAQQKLADVKEQFPEVAAFYCLEASFYSFEMGMSKIKAPLFYPRHQSAMLKAANLNENECLLAFERGNMLFHLPKILGGDKETAIECYLQTLDLLEHDVACDWFQLMVQLFLLKAYHITDQTENFKQLKLQIELQYGKLLWLSRFLETTIVK